jgi:hypothetical protein
MPRDFSIVDGAVRRLRWRRSKELLDKPNELFVLLRARAWENIIGSWRSFWT